jgi:hypothetical protein
VFGALPAFAGGPKGANPDGGGTAVVEGAPLFEESFFVTAALVSEDGAGAEVQAKTRMEAAAPKTDNLSRDILSS